MGFWDTMKDIGGWAIAPGLKAIDALGITDEPKGNVQQRQDLRNQGGMASWFADQGQAGFGRLGGEADALRAALARQAQGQGLVSSEMLRQGLQQNVAAQHAMAASASPQNQAMAARTAAMQAGRLGAGMSGQAALAGMQERAAAQQALAQFLLNQRQQELQAALGSRQNAISAYGGITPEKSKLEQWQPIINAGIGAAGIAAKGG